MVCTISFVGALAVRFFWVTSCVEIVLAVESVSVIKAEDVLIGVPSLASGVSSPLSFLLLPAKLSPAAASSSKVGRVVSLRRFLCPEPEGGGDGGVDVSSSEASGAGVVALLVLGAGVLGFALKKDRIEPDLGALDFGQHSTDGGTVVAKLGGGSCDVGVSSGLSCRGVEGFGSSLVAAVADRLPYVRIGFLRCCVAGPVSTASADIVDLIALFFFSSTTVAILVSIVEVWGEE